MSVELLATVAGVAAVAATLRRFPLPGVPPPAPPPAHADRQLVAAAEFAIAFATFGAAALASRLGPLLSPFAASAAYCAFAFAENGRFSGAIINPATVLALHVYGKDYWSRSVWEAAAEEATPYFVGILGAAVAFAAASRLGTSGAAKRKAD